MRAFEIQVYNAGKWNIDSIFDDRELALHEAQRMDHSGRHVGVRVVEEVYDEEKDRTSSRTIFRGSRADDSNAQHLEKSADVRREAEADRRRRQLGRNAAARRARKKKAKKRKNLTYFVVTVCLIAVFALGALLGLNYLQNLR